MPGGRPTKYHAGLCEALVTHMKQGGTFDAFCAAVPCSPARLYEWLKKYPEFQEAKTQGEALSQKFWEDLGKAGVAGQLKATTKHYVIVRDKKTGAEVRKLVRETEHPTSFNSATYNMIMKNRYGWKDKTEVENTNRIGLPDLSKLSEEELRALAAELAKIATG